MKLVPASKKKPEPAQEFYTHESKITLNQVNGFEALIKKGGTENQIQKYLEDNPSIFTVLLGQYQTGHHGSWVFPKQAIKPKTNELRGLIPDFIIVGKSSDGYEPYIVELKKAETPLFTKTRSKEIYLSSELNKGLCQMLEYIHYGSEYKNFLCKALNLKEIRDPKGIILLGNDKEMSDEGKQNIKYRLNDCLNEKIDIRTYSTIIRNLRPKYNFQKNHAKPLKRKLTNLSL